MGDKKVRAQKPSPKIWVCSLLTSEKKTTVGSKTIGSLRRFELVFDWKKMPLYSEWNFHFNR